MLSIKEVAKELNLSVRTIRRLIDSKEIKSVKIGGSVRISEDEVKRLKGE